MEKNVLQSLCTFDISAIENYENNCIKTVLPLLTRCVLCAPIEDDIASRKRRQLLMKMLLDFADVNFLVECLSTDFNEILNDTTNQLNLRKKQLQVGNPVKFYEDILVEFDSQSSTSQFKTVVTEIRWLIHCLNSRESTSSICIPPILECTLYQECITNLLCVAVHELPGVLQVPDVVEALLLLRNGGDIVYKVVLNVPWSIEEVCTSLVVRANDNESKVARRNRIKLLKDLCKLSCSAVSQATKACSEHGKLLPILAWLLLEQNGETTIFRVAEFIFTHRRVAKSLMSAKNNVGNEEPEVLVLIRKVLSDELDSLAEVPELEECHFTRLSLLIKLYACLRELIAYKFTDAECEKMFKLFLSLPVTTGRQMQLVIQALCLVISSIHQLSHYSQQLSSWMKTLAKNDQLYSQSSDASVGQFLLLIAIHFHGNQLSTISEIVSSILSIKPSVVKLTNTVLKQIFTYEIFTEQVISQRAVLLSITENLNGDMKGYLPVHCICQLLKSRAFSKYNVNISDWIFNQLCNVSLPIHPLVSQIIALYVTSTIPQQHNVRTANPQLDEKKLLNYFKSSSSEENFASQLTLLFYVLTHQDALQSDSGNMKRKTVQPYSSELISQLPAKLLVSKAYALKNKCGSLYSSLIKLMYTNLPHMCKAEMWLSDMIVYRRPNEIVKLFGSSLSDTSTANSIHKQYLKLRLVSDTLPDETLSVLLDTIKLVQKTPVDEVPRHMTMVLLETWLAYSKLEPERLYIATVNALKGSFGGLKEDQVVMDPLIVLQCLTKCSQPDLISIVLHLIDVYFRASNRFYQIKSQAKSGAPNLSNPLGLSDSQEICYSLLAAQESGGMQILLERCLPDSREFDDGILCNHKEIQALVCSHIHKIVIDTPNLAKLVSFQGYNHRLIPMAIRGIPSFHICLDYVPELLAQPDISKQVFAIRLTSALCRQYRIHKTFGMAKLCINTLNTLIGVLPTYSIIKNILPVIPEVSEMCQRMPVLHEDWTHFLAKLLPMLSAFKGIRSVPKHELKTIALSCS